MMFIRLLLVTFLLNTSFQLHAEQEVSALNQRLLKLKQYLKTEQKQSEQWIKALKRVDQRNQKRLDNKGINISLKAEQQLIEIQQSIQKKQQLLARYRVQLANTQKQIPAWLSLSSANQVNQDMQQKINETELLLQSAQQLDTQDWLLRTPEELWRELEPETKQ